MTAVIRRGDQGIDIRCVGELRTPDREAERREVSSPMIAAMIGGQQVPRRPVDRAVNAPPMTTATARSITLPR